MPQSLSLTEARAMALAAQGFDQPRPAKVQLRHVRRVIRQLGLVQLDYVNVLVPAHYQVLFSRLGPYDRGLLGDLIYRRREFTEQWAHEASIVPMEIWPLLQHRRDEYRIRPWGFEAFVKANPEYVAAAVELIRQRGPIGAEALPTPEGAPRRIHETWFGTVPRAVLETHFGRGVLAVADRRANFARTYDLAERVIPAEHFTRQVDRDASQRELLLLAARAHGVGTAADLADYYRMNVPQAKQRLAELGHAGTLVEARVEGWREPAYMHPLAHVPAHLKAHTLLSPFDPVVWFRARAARLFGFQYRVEIFVPEPQRKWGYYVLPFLMGDQLVARVDLKADRRAGQLLVPAAHLEPHSEADAVAAALALELQSMAAWLGLESVSVRRKGLLGRALAAALKGRS